MYDPTKDRSNVSDLSMRDTTPEDERVHVDGRSDTPSSASQQGAHVHMLHESEAPSMAPSSLDTTVDGPSEDSRPIMSYFGQSKATENGGHSSSKESKGPNRSTTHTSHNRPDLHPSEQSGLQRREMLAHESPRDTRSPASYSMSISAMLSNPVDRIIPQQLSVEADFDQDLEDDTELDTTYEPKSSRMKPVRKRANDEHSSARKVKARTSSDLRKRKETQIKSRPIVNDVYDPVGALLDSEESSPSDDEPYHERRLEFQSDWDLKSSKLALVESLAQRKRSSETSIRLLASLDRRVRKVQKVFENQHHREAYSRATVEEAMRKEQQRREKAAAGSRRQAKSMAPPSSTKGKLGKKRKRDSLASENAKAAVMDEDSAGKLKKQNSVEKVDSLLDSIWKDIAKKEIPKVYRIIQTHNINRTINQKKTGQLCAKEARRWQFRTNKTAKDMQAKSKRAMREMLIFWKRNERGDLLNRQKAEKEIIDRAKKEEEDRESRRQARKLNFLITQTELYSHFIGNKVKTAEAEQSEDTSGDARLSVSTPHPTLPLHDTTLPPGAPAAEIDFDADDDDALRAAAARNAQEAVHKAKEKAQGFDTESGARAMVSTGDAQADVDAMDLDFQNPTTLGESEIKQPKLLNATLKKYQLKGLNWLVNLYEQGINGILADEMGLGKTVQSISVMAHLAETYNIWGPFLVIAPASTLHNWQQEISKFVPRLKALPYWGNTKDRKVLRKFWDRKRATYSEDAPFHVVVTSYQLVVQDSQYFQNVKWQYMILDEAQAIKSSQSSRWKNLLGFKCRNRLLLTGTPIQNTMQELWALLHFIMPSLFDSHNEFSEWFSKDIESHAQKNSELDEEQLKRLHMILKPFMLRRVKKNVQKELGDKIELDVFCELNMRQRGLYSFLRREISMNDILEKASSDRDADLSSLMNLVMQLRKVCNHPDLFERADVRAPLAFVDVPKTANLAKEGRAIELSYASTSALKYHLPKFVYRHGGILDVPSETSSVGSRNYCLKNWFNIFSVENIHTSITRSGSAFAWCANLGLSPGEIALVRQEPLRCAIQARSPGRNQRQFTTTSMTLTADLAHSANEGEDVVPVAGTISNVMETLMSVHSSVISESRYHRIDPMYDMKVVAPPVDFLCPDWSACYQQEQSMYNQATRRVLHGLSLPEENAVVQKNLRLDPSILSQGLLPAPGQDKRGHNSIRMPSMQTFITDSGKLSKLDELLTELKKNDHRVLLYFQMTKMIDLMEEYLVYRQYKYLRLDGSSKISDRRDMVNDWQTRPELFVFLLSTRAGGLGINLTAADTVIFYDSDWNPTIDSQAMDRAHRLGQTKQVTVYRLITRGTIEERILSRAKEKEEVQKVVISGGDYKQNTTENLQFQAQKGGGRDVVSWLLEDDQVKKVSQQLENIPAKNRKGTKSRQGPSLDDLYHEGENRMESEAHSPEADGTEEPVAKHKKKSSKKKARVD